MLKNIPKAVAKAKAKLAIKITAIVHNPKREACISRLRGPGVSESKFEDKFVAFIDVMGFKEMIEAAERGDGRPIAEIFEIMDELGGEKVRASIHARGPKICPCSPRVRQDLAFEVTQVSDCAIVSAEVSPAGLINLVNHCWGAVMRLLTKGVLVRGYITRGGIIHVGSRIIGTGYQHAYTRESTGITAFKIEADEKGTPFVEVDPVVLSYVAEHGDECVTKMFGRMVESDGEVSALYPFKRLGHSFIIGGMGVPPFNAEKEKKQNEVVRRSIRKLIDRVNVGVAASNDRAIRKTRHYVAALEKQLKACDRTDELIDALSRPVGRRKPLL